VRQCFRLDHSWRNPGDTAEMPDVSGSIHSALEWNRAFILSGDTFARIPSDAECGIDFIYGSEEHPSPDSQI
jgi:hypothetical protein